MRSLLSHPKTRVALLVTSVLMLFVAGACAWGAWSGSWAWVASGVLVWLGWLSALLVGLVWALSRLKTARGEDVEAWRIQAAHADQIMRQTVSESDARIRDDLSGQIADQRKRVENADKAWKADRDRFNKQMNTGVREAKEQASEEVARIDGLLSGRIDHLDAITATRLEGIASQIAVLLTARDDVRRDLREMTRRIEQASGESEKKIAGVEKQTGETLKKVADAEGKLRASLQELETKLNALRRDLNKGFQKERSARSIGFARHDAKSRNPRRCLLVLGPPRTGSTWLLDALRFHPAIDFEPTPTLLQGLALARMNRYPSGLSGGADAGVDVEVWPDHGERIPEFGLPSWHELRQRLDLPHFSVEKIHPRFFDLDAAEFLENLATFERESGIEFTLLYRLRDPGSAIRSMLRYKLRDPKWYTFLEESEVPAYFEKEMKCVRHVFRARPGRVFDYGEHRARGHEALADEFMALWPDSDRAAQLEVAKLAEDSTDRIRRLKQQTLFLGERTSDDAGEADPLETLGRDAADVVERCREIYRSMMDGEASVEPEIKTRTVRSEA